MATFNFQILAAADQLCVVVDPQATEYIPYIFKNGNLYDPRNGYKPIDAPKKTKSLPDDQQKLADVLIVEGEAQFNDTLALGFLKKKLEQKEAQEATEKAVAEAVAKAKAEVASTTPVTPTTPQTTLDSLIAKSVAELSVNTVMSTVQPFIENYITETYGILPKSLKVELPTKTTEVKGRTHFKFETILKLVAAGESVFLTGPAGAGKNVICKQLAEALDTEFYFTNAVTQEYKLTGFIDANGHYHETQFFKAFTQGGVFMLDEMDASIPEVLIILNAALANGYFDFPIGKFEAHKDFHCVAAGNTYGTGADIEYTGRFQLDAASLDRFTVVEVPYDPDIELDIAGGNKELVSFIHEFRTALKNADIKFVVSYRAISRLTKFYQMFDIREAIQLAILKGLDTDDAKVVAKNLPSVHNQFIYEFKKMMAA